MGREGEDVAATPAADGPSLRMPTRFHPASVKGAAWQVGTPPPPIAADPGNFESRLNWSLPVRL